MSTALDPSVGGAFRPSEDYVVGGSWTFLGAVRFLGATSGGGGGSGTDVTVSSSNGTNDSVAIQAALTAAAGGSLGFAEGTYWVGTTLLPPSNVRIQGPGKLKAAAGLGAFAPVIDLSGVTDVVIENLEIDGNKSAYAGVTEHRHGIRLVGNTKRVTLRDLYLHDCKGDGLYIGSGDGSTYVEIVDVENVRCDANHRQGLSITALRGGYFRNCWFTNTSGTAPQAGVDIEPNSASAVVEDIVFDGGGAYGNADHGFLFEMPTTSLVQQNITLRGFTARNNTGSGICIRQGKNVIIEGCGVRDNTDRGILITDNCRNVAIVRNRISGNGTQGIYVLAQFNTKYLLGLSLVGNRIFDNSATTPNAVDAIRIDWALGAASGCLGPVVVENNCSNQETSNQRYALTTDGGSKFTDLILSNNYLKGCATGVAVLSDDSGTRHVRGNAGLADN